MNFIEAVKEMKKGRKVIDTRTGIEVGIAKTGEFIQIHNGKEYIITSGRILTETWEIVEGKTLSDKAIGSCICGCKSIKGCFKEKDVKEALKEFLDTIQSIHIAKKAEEIFGKELI